jgi:hypothetical protein
MQDIFGQVHWRTLRNFNDKKAPEFCNAGAFCLANYLVVDSTTGSCSAACIAAICA